MGGDRDIKEIKGERKQERKAGKLKKKEEEILQERGRNFPHPPASISLSAPPHPTRRISPLC